MKVKPCPKCNQHPEFHDEDFIYPIARPNAKGVYDKWRGGCIENLGGCGVEVQGSSVQDTINKWNTRWDIDSSTDCTFCGSKVDTLSHDYCRTTGKPIKGDNGVQLWKAGCSNCGAHTLGYSSIEAKRYWEMKNNNLFAGVTVDQLKNDCNILDNIRIGSQADITDMHQHIIDDYNYVLLGKVDNKCFVMLACPELQSWELIHNDTLYSYDDLWILHEIFVSDYNDKKEVMTMKN